jgi:hypothetical protein
MQTYRDGSYELSRNQPGQVAGQVDDQNTYDTNRFGEAQKRMAELQAETERIQKQLEEDGKKTWRDYAGAALNRGVQGGTMAGQASGWNPYAIAAGAVGGAGVGLFEKHNERGPQSGGDMSGAFASVNDSIRYQMAQDMYDRQMRMMSPQQQASMKTPQANGQPINHPGSRPLNEF